MFVLLEQPNINILTANEGQQWARIHSIWKNIKLRKNENTGKNTTCIIEREHSYKYKIEYNRERERKKNREEKSGNTHQHM